MYAKQQENTSRDALVVADILSTMEDAISTKSYMITTPSYDGTPLDRALYHDYSNPEISSYAAGGASSSVSSSPSHYSSSCYDWADGQTAPLQTTQPQQTTPKPRGRNMGGRKPIKDDRLTPEEEKRRQIRRERNKMAAARCRKRRVDHTNTLVEETEGLEMKRNKLEVEIEDLQKQREELQFILDSHKMVCALSNNNSNHQHQHQHQHPQLQYEAPPIPKIKQEQLDRYDDQEYREHDMDEQDGATCGQFHETTTTATIGNNKSRPGTLELKPFPGIGSLNVDRLLQGGTGLTPVTPFPHIVHSHNHQVEPTVTASSLTASRPSFLPLKSLFDSRGGGMSLTTPTMGLDFTLDCLFDGNLGMTPMSTGLTPAAAVPTCSTQQRSSSGDMSSPDAIYPPKLVSL